MALRRLATYIQTTAKRRGLNDCDIQEVCVEVRGWLL